MLLNIPNEQLQLIEEVRVALDRCFAEGDLDKASRLETQLSNLCITLVVAELDKSKRIHAH